MKVIAADGGCLCGAVRYSIKGTVIWAGHCHCEYCRRQTSSPLSSFFCVRESELMFSGDSMAVYESSPGINRGFCKKCGSPMYYTSVARKGEIDIFAATLDNPDLYEPQEHYNWNERLPWITYHDTLPKHDKDRPE